MIDRLEFKSTLAVDETGVITGIAWPFGSADKAGDIITKGAFNIAVQDMPMLLGHDPEMPIGLWDEIAETSEGLQVKGRLDGSTRARAVRGMILGGLIGGLSIGFTTKSASKRGANRVITALDLKEISVVRNPAHPRARITSAKDATAAIAEAITRAAVALRKS